MHRAPVLTEDFFASSVLDDPYPLYERLRDQGPVHLLPALGLHLVVRHAQVLEALDDPATYSSNLVGLLYAGEDGVALLDTGGPDSGTDVLATADPPAHTAHRRIVQGTFSRRAVGDLRTEIEGIVAPRVRALVAAGGGDWMASVATPLPVLMIGRILGMPDDDAERLTAWSDAGVELLSGLADGDRMGELAAEIFGFMAYLREHLERARREPTGSLTDQVAQAWADGVLSGDEATSMLLQLVTAGSESTTSLIGSATRLLAEDPELQERIRADDALVDTLVEEAVRLESPFRGHFRVTTRDAELGGVHLPEGSRLMLLWGAANRDASAFPAPGDLDLARPAARSHSSFGRGIHFCIGAHLARLEATVAVRALLAATDRIALASDAEPAYVPSMFVRRLAVLPLLVSDEKGAG
ncbi:cytochrome P450 [Streptomycetaceae bacterium NBC_01309]